MDGSKNERAGGPTGQQEDLYRTNGRTNGRKEGRMNNDQQERHTSILHINSWREYSHRHHVHTEHVHMEHVHRVHVHGSSQARNRMQYARLFAEQQVAQVVNDGSVEYIFQQFLQWWNPHTSTTDPHTSTTDTHAYTTRGEP